MSRGGLGPSGVDSREPGTDSLASSQGLVAGFRERLQGAFRRRSGRLEKYFGCSEEHRWRRGLSDGTGRQPILRTRHGPALPSEFPPQAFRLKIDGLFTVPCGQIEAEHRRAVKSAEGRPRREDYLPCLLRRESRESMNGFCGRSTNRLASRPFGSL